MSTLTAFDHLLAANRVYLDAGGHRDLPVRPSRHLAIVTCMDSRIDTFAAVGLDLGEAHVIRTAGARVSDEVLRSLVLSTHVLGTDHVAVIGHTDCGLRDPDGTLHERLTALLGHPPSDATWRTFTDPVDAVRQDCEVLASWPDRPDVLAVAGYVLDVADGTLRQVVAPRVVPPPTT